jgi:hypothetical protein
LGVVWAQAHVWGVRLIRPCPLSSPEPIYVVESPANRTQTVRISGVVAYVDIILSLVGVRMAGVRLGQGG